ncbi:Uncharacterized protein YP598_4396 (plasmid) [Yersinia pseudotuberculosis]|nr:Uncharacterized protein YP598_4396 [Yersinia pseudotuberculosis]
MAVFSEIIALGITLAVGGNNQYHAQRDNMWEDSAVTWRMIGSKLVTSRLSAVPR